MRAVVVYESMYGNTHHVADAIGDGLRTSADVTVVPVDQALADLIASADLLVVGGPTHVHGMSRASTRTAAVEATQKPGNELELDPDAEGPGLRDWFDTFDRVDMPAAAFDTRVSGPPAFTGRASKGIARRLQRHGASLVVPPMSFLVTKETHLEPDEAERAREWGDEIGRAAASRPSAPAGA
jgi:Flavodoxin